MNKLQIFFWYYDIRFSSSGFFFFNCQKKKKNTWYNDEGWWGKAGAVGFIVVVVHSLCFIVYIYIYIYEYLVPSFIYICIDTQCSTSTPIIQASRASVLNQRATKMGFTLSQTTNNYWPYFNWLLLFTISDKKFTLKQVEIYRKI